MFVDSVSPTSFWDSSGGDQNFSKQHQKYSTKIIARRARPREFIALALIFKKNTDTYSESERYFIAEEELIAISGKRLRKRKISLLLSFCQYFHVFQYRGVDIIPFLAQEKNPEIYNFQSCSDGGSIVSPR